jgi:hypothetical protein
LNIFRRDRWDGLCMVRRSAVLLMDGSSPCLSLHRVDLGDKWAAHASMGEGGSPTARPRHQTSDGPAVTGIGSAGNVSVTTVPSPGTRSMWSGPPSAPAWPAWRPFRGARRRRPCGGADRAFQGAAGDVNGGSAGGRPGFPNRVLPVPRSRLDRAHVSGPCPAPRTRRAGRHIKHPWGLVVGCLHWREIPPTRFCQSQRGRMSDTGRNTPECAITRTSSGGGPPRALDRPIARGRQGPSMTECGLHGS